MLSARALFFEPSQSCKAPGLTCPIRVTIAIATSVRSPDSTHWGCRATTPAVGLTPGRRSNGLPKQSRYALFALPVRFSPPEKFSFVPGCSRKFRHLGQFKNRLRIDQNPAKLARHPVCLMPPRQRSLSQHPKG